MAALGKADIRPRLDCTLLQPLNFISPFAFVKGQSDGPKLYLHLLNAALDEKKGCAFLHARKPLREDEHPDDRHPQHSQVPLLKFPKPAYSLR